MRTLDGTGALICEAGCADQWIAAKGHDGRGLEASIGTAFVSGKWRVVVAWAHDMIQLPLDAVLHITPSSLHVEGFCRGGDVVVSLDLEANMIDVRVNGKGVLRLVVTEVETKPLWGCPTSISLMHCSALGLSWD